MQNRMVRATEYRRLAIAAAALAETSLLANVREKHEKAAATWTALATLDARPTQPRPAQAERSGQALPGPCLPQFDKDKPCIA